MGCECKFRQLCEYFLLDSVDEHFGRCMFKANWSGCMKCDQTSLIQNLLSVHCRVEKILNFCIVKQLI